MDLGNIITNSFKYPAGDLKKFLIICILCALPFIPLFCFDLMDNNVEILVGIWLILVLVEILIIPGYLISVVKEGCGLSKSVPSIKVGRNIINTLKYILLNIIYSLVPLLVLVIGVFALGMSSLPVFESITKITKLDDVANLLSNIPNMLSNFINSILILLAVFLIVSFIFSLLSYVATARFAKHNKLGEAFRSIIGDIKQIGVLKLIAWYIVMGMMVSIIVDVAAFVLFVPYAGVFIYFAIVFPYVLMVYYYSLGLLHSSVEGSDEEFDFDEFDLNEFEKEIKSIRRMYYE